LPGSRDSARGSPALPTADTFGAFPTSTTTATLDGDVNATGQTTTYKASYDLASSTWCTSGGSNGMPANSTTPQTLGFTDGTFHAVSVDLSSLSAGANYCAGSGRHPLEPRLRLCFNVGSAYPGSAPSGRVWTCRVGVSLL
jgi:hypothetical protein